MAGHFHYRGLHYGFQPREPRIHPHHHRGLYLFAFALAAIIALAWTHQPVNELLPVPTP